MISYKIYIPKKILTLRSGIGLKPRVRKDYRIGRSQENFQKRFERALKIEKEKRLKAQALAKEQAEKEAREKIESQKKLVRFKRLLMRGREKYSGFKKRYFHASKHHAEYIKFDAKHHSGNKNFLFSKFMTYINSIPYSRPPFIFALYVTTLVPQFLYVLKNIKYQGPNIGWAKGLLYLTIFCVILSILWWFYDLFMETQNIGKHNQKVTTSMSYGFMVFMLSEVCIFGGLFWGLFDRLFHASETLQNTIMPSGVHGLPTMELVFRGTLLLSLSCAAFNSMHRNLKTGDNYRARFWGHITIIFGASFLIQQLNEYINLPYLMSTNAHCSFFYAITGLHGIHVILGLIFIGTIVDKTEQEKFSASDLNSVTYTGVYWYFVDIVWIVLNFTVYAYALVTPISVMNESFSVLDSMCSHVETFVTVAREFSGTPEAISFFDFLKINFGNITYPFDFYMSYITFAFSHPFDWFKLTTQVCSEFFSGYAFSFYMSYIHLIFTDPIWYFKFMWVNIKDLLYCLYHVIFVFLKYSLIFLFRICS